MNKKFLLTIFAILTIAAPALAGDVLWFWGHNGFDGDGHADLQALLEAEGATFDSDGSAILPVLDSYGLIFISMPGMYDAADYFTPDEKVRLNSWLGVGSHRVVMIGEWDGFYPGQDVMEDLLASIGNPIVFVPGAYDSGCGHINGPLGDPDPLTDGLDHVHYAYTSTWDPAFGVPLAYPEDTAAPGPYIVSNGTDIPCIVGIGDSNATSDLCGQLNAIGGDADTMEFHRRLYNITCSGEIQWACCLPSGNCVMLTEGDCADANGTFYMGLACDEVVCYTATEKASWGSLKTEYR